MRNPKDITRKEDIKGRKVALYFNMASMSPTIELHAGLARDLLSRDNDVTVYLLDKSFKSPTENPFNRKTITGFSRFRALDAVKGLPVKVKTIDLSGVSNQVPKAIEKSLDLGAMSSIASATKASDKSELNKKWLKVHANMLDSAKRLYNYFFKEIREEEYDFVFMFNGRFGCVKPVLEAARDSDIGFGLNEVKKSTHEIVFVNQLIHSIDGNTQRALAAYEENEKEAEKYGKEFFDKKLKNEDTGDVVYSKNQESGRLPEEIIYTKKKVIALYPTTDDEFKFIGKEWDGYVPDSQIDEIEDLAHNLDEEKYMIVVKMHPNQANIPKKALDRYYNLSNIFPHVRLEKPLSKTDTYALMKRADIVVTFASTIGVEACYSGKPSILIGDTNWSKMNVAHKVKSGKEAAELIKKDPEPLPKKGAIIWGNYLYKYKDKLSGYKRVKNGDYWVDGRRIGKSTWRRILQLPAKLEIETSKPGFKINKVFMSRLLSVASNIIQGRWTS